MSSDIVVCDVFTIRMDRGVCGSRTYADTQRANSSVAARCVAFSVSSNNAPNLTGSLLELSSLLEMASSSSSSLELAAACSAAALAEDRSVLSPSSSSSLELAAACSAAALAENSLRPPETRQ